jgi:intraflagellar transport protein 122
MNELKTEYCAFNSEFEEMFAYGGDGLIFVRTVAFSGVNWPLKGFLAGFRGSKIKMLSGSNLNTVDIPLSSFMDHFITRKDFAKAYQIASLGIPDQEMKSLGISALRNK